MYSIIYWDEDSNLRPKLNSDGTLFTTDSVNEADYEAEQMEEKSEGMIECRVISIDGVKI